jgi:hypothetical protein
VELAISELGEKLAVNLVAEDEELVGSACSIQVVIDIAL